MLILQNARPPLTSNVMNRAPYQHFDGSQSPNLFMRLHKEPMIFDPLDELMRSQESKVTIGNDSQARAKVAKQRREKLTHTFEKLKELLIPFGADPNAGRTKLLDYSTELITKISQDPTFHHNREQ